MYNKSHVPVSQQVCPACGGIRWERQLLASTASQRNLDYAKHDLKCHGDCYTLSQGFVWINISLFNQLAEFWVAYFPVLCFPASQRMAITSMWMHHAQFVARKSSSALSWLRGTAVSIRTVSCTAWLRGNHLSNATCLTQVFFKSGEECSMLWCSLTRQHTHITQEAVLDK